MSVSIVEEKDFVRVRFYGVLTSQDILELLAALEAVEGRRGRMPPHLADFREVTEMQIRFPDVEVAAGARRGIRFPNAYRAAILVGNAVQSGMARMYRTLNDNPQLELEIFADESAALVWLLS